MRDSEVMFGFNLCKDHQLFYEKDAKIMQLARKKRKPHLTGN